MFFFKTIGYTIIVLIVLVLLSTLIPNKDKENYLGVNLSSEWDPASTCKTTRYMIKKGGHLTKSKMDRLYNLKCTVSKLTAPLFGAFARYKPYAVSWPNGVAARVFIETTGIRMMGFSTDGIPFSWNSAHKPIAKSESDYAQECRELFVNKANAKKVKIASIEKYNDLSGVNVKLTYFDENQTETKGTCLFDRVKMIAASSKVESDQYSKSIYSKY